MSESASIAGAGDSSTARTPNMGVNTPEINDNWQHISSPVARIVADVMRRMEERERSDG